jgi:hypothetical protein
MALTKITKSGLGNNAVESDKINADAIDATKIADNAISEEHLDPTAITGNTELSANAATDDILLIYDASNGTLKKINAGNVGLQAPTISSVSPSNLLTGDGTGNYTITITGTGFLADATAKLVTDGGTDISFDSVTRNSSTQLTCVVAKNTANLTNANEPFDVVVTTAGALSGTSADAITIDASPVFVTASGSIGSTLEETSGTHYVNATDPESAGNVTFELQSGSLPPNFTLTNSAADGGTAVISGTAGAVAANTTYNFTLRAIDAASNTTSRAFSITIQNNPVTESFTSSGTFSVPAGVTVADVLVVGGGGGGVAQASTAPTHCAGGGGGGAGGLIFMPEYPVQACGTITVTVGAGMGNACAPFSGATPTGNDSIFGSPGDPGLTPTSEVLTALGGGLSGTGYQPGIGAYRGGSGGGGNGTALQPTGDNGGFALQPTQPGNSGAYGFGNPGGDGTNSDGGGGGGAGAAGAPSGGGGNGGGIGRAYTIADGTTPVYYAGGGGGGPSGTGGQGGGGSASSQPVPGSRCGAANKGGGAGGNASMDIGYARGGKGIVIVRY